jgi:hypothetical protein
MPALTYTDRLERENRMLRSELMRLRLPLTPTEAPPDPLILPRDIWRFLVQWAHPDRHPPHSPAAHRVTQWLMEHRP